MNQKPIDENYVSLNVAERKGRKLERETKEVLSEKS